MMSKPRLLDLFCGGGGAGMGYHLAGFEVVGVDNRPQKNYPFRFIQADALEYIAQHGHEFEAIHASPPCQAYSVTSALSNGNHPELIEPTRAALQAAGRPYIIENVPGAPLKNPLMLCGTMFGLRVIRHRLFECSPVIWWPPFSCCHWGTTGGGATGPVSSFAKGDFICVAGERYKVADARIAMDIPWMTTSELSQAIPPKYTEFIGRQLIEAL